MSWIILLIHYFSCLFLGAGVIVSLAAHFKGDWAQELMKHLPKLKIGLWIWAGCIIILLSVLRSHYHFEDFHGNKGLWFSPLYIVVRNAFYLISLFLGLHFLKKLPSLSLILFFVIANLFSFDWGMSLEHHWFSNLYGLIYLGSGFAAAASVMTLLQFQELTEKTKKDYIHLLLVGCLFWFYLQFSQFIILWMGNLPREAVYYVKRIETYGIWWIAVMGGLKTLPIVYASLKSFNIKIVCCLVLVSYLMELKWMVDP